MDDVKWEGVGDRHLNLFYTYRTHHLEDNVTRALILTLRNLAPVHLRLFLRDVILNKPKQAGLRGRMQLLAENDFRFELQVSSPDDRLDADSGVIVGVKYSETQLPPFDETYQAEGGARPDALVIDTVNDLTVIFEIKLGDSLYREQIQRHFNSFFDQSSASLDQVFVEITWSYIAEFLQRIVRQSVSERERFVVTEFIRYLDWLMLVKFLGFQAGDFITQNGETFNYGKLNNFLLLVTNALESELALKPYQNKGMLFFQDVPYENLYVEMTASGLDCGIVCGSGKIWRAQRIRDYIISNPNEFKKLLDHLRSSLDPAFPIVLRLHSYFRHSRFRTEWLGDLGGKNLYPDDYKTFLATLSDPNLNAFQRVSKAAIQERFVSQIERHKQESNIEVDSEGRFPKWQDIDEFLQYTYFHVDVQIPSTVLVGRTNDNLFKTFKSVLEPQHEVMRALSTV